RSREHGACAPATVSRSNVFSMPGWHPREVGTQHGWKVYPNGWVGHIVVLRREVGQIAVQPESGAAMFLWTNTAFAAEVAHLIFGGLMPSVVTRVPKRLSAAEWALENAARYLGTFRSGSEVLRIDECGPHGLSGVREGAWFQKEPVRVNY